MDEQHVILGGAQQHEESPRPEEQYTNKRPERPSSPVVGQGGLDVSVARMRQVADHLLGIVAIYDAERRIQFLNAYGLRLSKRAENEILGRRDEEIFPTELTNHYLPILQRAYETGARQRTELWLPAPFGGRTVILDCLPIHDEDGRLAQVLTAAMDITGRKRAEQRLRETNQDLEQQVDQRTAQLRSLALDMSQAQEQERQRVADQVHGDLHQSLIAAQIQLGLGRQSSGSKAWEFLDQVDHTLQEAIRAIRDLTAELSPPILCDADLSLAMEWLGHWVQEKRHLHVQVTIGEGIDVPSEALRTLLFRMGQELLLKVVEHGNVPRAKLNLEQRDEEVLLTIQYPDVSTDQVKTGKDEGALDLAGIRERTECLGGHLDMVHTPGRGTSITLRLASGSGAPVAASASTPTGETPASEKTPPATPRIRILIADDHRIVRQGLAMVLQNETDIAVVGEADNGQQALEMARQLSPDVVLMDMSMPLMDGVQATERIRRDLPDTLVIGLSMYTEKAMMARMRAAGVAAYVNKGGDPAELLRIVRQLVGGRVS